MAKIFLIGSHLNYNLEHFTKVACENLGQSISFFGYKDLMRQYPLFVRMALTRSSMVRSFSKHLFLNRINQTIRNTIKELNPDLVISIKGEMVTPETLEWLRRNVGVKTALWYPDDPRFFESLVKYIAPHYDHVFTASKRAITMYREIGVKNVDFLPFACEPLIHKKTNLTETEYNFYKSDVCFVGTYTPRRAKMIKNLWKAGVNVRVWGPYWRYFVKDRKINAGVFGQEMVKVFNAAKIVLNLHEQSDVPYKVNMRVYEAAGCGAFLMTDNSYGLNQMFSTQDEIVTYDSSKDLIRKIGYYLNSEKRSVFQEKALLRAYEDHTYHLRLKRLLEHVGFADF
jgi:spore maturation protein CgeB